MADDHKTVAISISATLAAGLILLGLTTALNGWSFSLDLFQRYVLPMMISSFTLFVFFLFLVGLKFKARRSKKIPVGVPAPPPS